MTDLTQLPKIGIIGLSRSGKSFATEILKKRFNFISFTISDVIRDYAKENGIKLESRNDFWNTANDMDNKFGTDYLLKKSLEKLADQVKNDYQIHGVILEGIRRYDVAKGLKGMPNSLLICISSPHQMRFERQRDFRPEDSSKNINDFIEIEKPEEVMFNKTKTLANITIINDKTKSEFEEEIIQSVKKFLLS